MKLSTVIAALALVAAIACLPYLFSESSRPDAVSVTTTAPVLTSDKAAIAKLVAEGKLPKDYLQAAVILECTANEYPWSLGQNPDQPKEWALIVHAGEDRLELVDLRATEGTLAIRHWTGGESEVWTLDPESAKWGLEGPFIDIAYASASLVASAEMMKMTRAVEELQKAADK